ncbi:tyrosine-type recombinase/integrase [Serratia marcescens]|uniref:phage integrase n=1 Tax=Serratia marcescens TaxID=615 RepID=UPI002404E88C|nr:tyrosine-type recombinase/integrase [Serratia marcescens]MDF9722504.1 tyrosine-type recombinase/integrase [Serratia marcescens]
MAVRKTKNGKWLCECYPNGRKGKRHRKEFATKGEALAFEQYVIDEFNAKPWLGEKEDKRKLSEVLKQWYTLHGRTLTNGESTYSKLQFMCDCLGDPNASQLTPDMLAEYREKRMTGHYIHPKNKYRKGVAAATVNLDQRHLSSVFGALKKLNKWDLPNPAQGFPKLKTHQKELVFLEDEQIRTLLDSCCRSECKSLIHVVRICLATGARWGEAENLLGRQVRQYRILFSETKNKKNRTVPISKELYDTLPKKTGRLFDNCRWYFVKALREAGIELPERQCTHVLRHTFASHFMMNGGNILVLRDILGHSNINMTMIYAHFAPDHLEDAVSKNPLGRLKFGEQAGDEMAA